MGFITGSVVLDELARRIISSGEMKIRDVDGGEEPFLYSSGNKGPGYVSIKALVSRAQLFRALVANLAHRVVQEFPEVNFIAANVTGGVPPGVMLQEELSRILGRDVPMVYVRDTRKLGGLKEHVTGLDGITPGYQGLVVEELVNYATTTTNSAYLLRDLGFLVPYAACIVNYDTVPSRALLVEHHVQLIHLLTIDQLLSVAEAERTFGWRLIASYRNFLADPTAWMDARGLVREERGGTK